MQSLNRSKITLWLVAICLLVSTFGSFAGAQGELTVAMLEQSLEDLQQALEKSPNRSSKLQLLDRYHRMMRAEIRKKADTDIRDDAYWRAVDIDVMIVNLMDRSCDELKTAIRFADLNTTENESSAVSNETTQALELADMICGN